MPTPNGVSQEKILPKVAIFTNCLICNKKIKTIPSRIKKGQDKYCSREHFHQSRRGVPSWNKGKKWPDEWKKKMSKDFKGRTFNTGRTHFKKGQNIGNKHPHWKGGRTIANNGYIWIYQPNHPNAFHCYVLEHRIIMEKYLERYLTKDEVVHHINGVRMDNRIENLQLFLSNSEHLKFELTGKSKHKYGI